MAWHEAKGKVELYSRRDPKRKDCLKKFDHENGNSKKQKKPPHRRPELLIAARRTRLLPVIQRKAIKLAGYGSFFENYEIAKE